MSGNLAIVPVGRRSKPNSGDYPAYRALSGSGDSSEPDVSVCRGIVPSRGGEWLVRIYPESEQATPSIVDAVLSYAASEQKRLAKALNDVLTRTGLDAAERAIAERAKNNALLLARRIVLAGSPTFSYSEDGFLSMLWQNQREGAMLIFTGDGKASVSLTSPQQFYSENEVEVDIFDPSDALPNAFYEAISRVSR